MDKNNVKFPLNDKLLQESLTHSSYAMRYGVQSNERLEYLGDAVLELVVSEELMNRFPDANEGELSRIRANIVSEKSLTKIALLLEIENKIKVSGLKDNKQPSILSDAVEAIIGAIYIENGFFAAKQFIKEHFEAIFSDAVEITECYDYKTKLQEFLQKGGKNPPVYKLISESGLSHDKKFVVAVIFDGQELAQAIDKSKKQAGQNAAKAALLKLNK